MRCIWGRRVKISKGCTSAFVSPGGTEIRPEWGERNVSVEAAKKYAQRLGRSDRRKSLPVGLIKEKENEENRPETAAHENRGKWAFF